MIETTTVRATIRWIAPLTYRVNIPGRGHFKMRADTTGQLFDKVDAMIVEEGYALDSIEWVSAGNHYWEARSK